MGLALGRGDQSQQLSWSSGSATWSFEINFANGTEAPEWIQIYSNSQIVVKDDEIDPGNYEFSLTGTPTEACYNLEPVTEYFNLEVYSFTASSLEDIEYEIKEPILTKTFEFAQY